MENNHLNSFEWKQKYTMQELVTENIFKSSKSVGEGSMPYLLCGLQSQPNTGAGCLYFIRILPSTWRTMLSVWTKYRRPSRPGQQWWTKFHFPCIKVSFYCHELARSFFNKIFSQEMYFAIQISTFHFITWTGKWFEKCVKVMRWVKSSELDYKA